MVLGTYKIFNCIVVYPKYPLLKGQRCVILADGFYEWRREAKDKQPFFIYFPQSQGLSAKKENEEQNEPSVLNPENSEEGSVDETEVGFVFFLFFLLYFFYIYNTLAYGGLLKFAINKHKYQL